LLGKEIGWGKSSTQITELSFVLHHHVGPHCVVGKLFFRLAINERKCLRVLGNVTDDFIRNLRFVLAVILRHGMCNTEVTIRTTCCTLDTSYLPDRLYRVCEKSVCACAIRMLHCAGSGKLLYIKRVRWHK